MRLSHVKGFTLVEVAIALVVVGLLIAGGMNLMTASSESSRYKSTQTSLSEIKQSLQGYYVINQRLPCPDTDLPNTAGFGEENVTAGVCDATRGWLPHLTLGAGGNGDAWGERFKYVVSGDNSKVSGDNSNFFTTKTTNCTYTRPTSASATTVRVQDLSTAGAANYLSDFNAFVVLSTGKNGRQTNTGMTGAFSNNGGCSSLNALEQENCDDDSMLRYGTNMSDGSSLVFDDMLVWIGDMPLLHQLIKNGCGAVTSGSTPAPVVPDVTQQTTTDFTAGATTHKGDYNGNDSISTTSSNDKVVIKGDLEKDLNLKDGDNTLLVEGNMTNSNSDNVLQGGSGKDIVRIQGNLYEGVHLEGGDDQLEVVGNVELNADSIDMGAGNDQVRLYGDVKDTEIKLGAGENTIYIKGNIDDVKITASGGTGVLYYDSNQKPSSSKLELGSTVTIKCKINNTWTDCP